MIELPGRIAIDPAICGGRPHFAGTRIPVYIVLEMLANNESEQDILTAYPDLTKDDLRDALIYAREIAEVPRQTLAAGV